MPDRVNLKYIFFFLTYFALPLQSNAAALVGDMKATVVEKVVVDGNDLLLTLDRQNTTNGRVYGQGKGHYYNGNVIYNVQSEPNSMITVHYQAIDNNATFRRKFDSANRSDDNIVKLSFRSNTKLVNFDKKGNGLLSVNPILFFPNYDYESDHKAIYYVTLFY